MVMTVHDSIQHLGEQKPRLLLVKAFPVAHIRVHVTMVTRQEDIHLVLANYNVLQSADVFMFTNPIIGRQPLLVSTQWEHLWGKKGVTVMGNVV